MQTQTLNNHLIFTIIAPNYGPQAMILGESIAKSIPDAIFRIVVLQDCKNVGVIQNGIDEYTRTSNRHLDHKAVSFQEFNWSNFDVINAVNQYDLLEFATSIKPTILKNYLESGYTRVTYLDPDIQVFSDFSGSLSSSKCISVTPHILSDYPDDLEIPDQRSILYAGIYNLGFISVLSDSREFLEWWERKLNTYCIMDVENGYHVDQKWVDWATSFIDLDVVRDPGLNVAYWNLHERRFLDGQRNQVINGRGQCFPLRFFHFSGFIGPEIDRISKHCTRKFAESTSLQQILQSYHDRREFWRKFLGYHVWTLGGRLAGAQIPKNWRQDISEYVRNQKTSKLPKKGGQFKARQTCNCLECESTFNLDSIKSLLTHIDSNVIRDLRGISKNNIALELYKFGYAKKDLLIDEFRGRGETTLLVIGYFAAPTGVGQIARNTLRLLESYGIPANIHMIRTGFDDPLLLEEYQRYQVKTGREASVLAFVNADMWSEHLVKTGLINLETQFVVGVWAWEIENVPPYFRTAYEYTSKVYALSQFSASALSDLLREEIGVFPCYGNISIEFKKYASLESKPKRYVLMRFDAKSVIERKNPKAVLDLWALVEHRLPQYELVIKSIDFYEFAPEELIKQVESSKRTRLIDEVYDADQNDLLLRDATAYISLHRAEGLGLNLLEALAADVPTIATSYSGITTEIQSLIFGVDYELVEVGGNAAPYPEDGRWANPNIQSAAMQLMKAIELVESGVWEKGNSIRRQSLELFLQKAQNLTLANVAQLLSCSGERARKDMVINQKPKLRISFLARFFPVYKRFPFWLRIKLKRLFLTYFTI